MILQKIELYNFRSFYGKQVIEFSDDNSKNITLIHAQNGTGKTNLLNAVLWNFYGISTGKFENKNLLFNSEAFSEKAINCSVTVYFSHDEVEYISRRTLEKDQKKTSLKIFQKKDGNLKESKIPETLINGIIHPEMAKHFFFDGEHAETFSSEGNHKNISEAIKQILGCQIAEVTLKDIKEVRKKIEILYKDDLEDNNLRGMANEIARIRLDIDNAPDIEEHYEKKKEQLNTKLSDIISQLAVHKKSKDLQNRKNHLENSLNQQKSNLENIKKDISKWIDDAALPLISNKIIQDVDKILSEQKQKSKIPEKYQKSFVEDLLNECLCVCGRSFEKNSEEYNNIKSMLNESADSELIDRYDRVKSHSASLKSLSANASPSLKALTTNKENLIQNISNYEKQLNTLEDDFRTIDDDEIEKLKKNELETKKEIEAHIKEFQLINQNKFMQKSRLEELEKQLSEAQKEAKKNELIAIQRELIISVEDRLTSLLKDEIDTARKIIQNQVNKYLETAGTGILSIKILEDFKIKVFQDNRELPKSGGQNQLISLVFTAALIWFSKMRSPAEGHPILLKGVKAPLFLDAPFGQLDAEFQKRVCEILPELSDQLIILFSDSQGNEVVRNILNKHVSKQYIIESHVKNKKLDGMSDQEITINNITYPRAFYEAQTPKSLIKEIS